MSPSSPRPHGHGTLLGRYVIRERLGEGSLGAVYKVWDEVSERLVALKILRTEQALGEASSRMEEEFRAIASLRHPQIARPISVRVTSQRTRRLVRTRHWPATVTVAMAGILLGKIYLPAVQRHRSLVVPPRKIVPRT